MLYFAHLFYQRVSFLTFLSFHYLLTRFEEITETKLNSVPASKELCAFNGKLMTEQAASFRAEYIT